MPIWGQVELLCRAISQEGQKEAEKILAQATADARRIIGEARERSQKELEREVLSERGKLHAEAKRLVDSAELEARRRVMTFREEVIREVLHGVEERWKESREGPSYLDFLLHALRDGIEHLPGKELVVELPPEDLKRIEEGIGTVARELSLEIEVMPSSSMEGGVRVYTADRRLLYDNTFSGRMKRIENDIRRHIWREILGTEGQEK